MDQRRKVVVTGAAGRIAGLMPPALRERYDLTLLDVRTTSRDGAKMDDVQIRIGAPRETDLDTCPPGDLRCVRRAVAAYVSQRDLSQLFIKSIEAQDVRDERGVPFQIFYGISDNPHAFWSIANARRIVGYEPQDNSEIRFQEKIADHMAAARGRM